MACGCQKKGAASAFVYTAPDGTKKEYRTEIEARAAVIRAGGGSYAAK